MQVEYCRSMDWRWMALHIAYAQCILYYMVHSKHHAHRECPASPVCTRGRRSILAGGVCVYFGYNIICMSDVSALRVFFWVYVFVCVGSMFGASLRVYGHRARCIYITIKWWTHALCEWVCARQSDHLTIHTHTHSIMERRGSRSHCADDHLLCRG